MPSTGLTVAVTGPTGGLGLSVVHALERSLALKRIVGMARRRFDPSDRGWRKTEYRQGDVIDARSVRELVKGADVVVHLAFAILSASDATREMNMTASRRVFEESAKAGAERICYASSVAAYGFHHDNLDWLTEEVPPRGSRQHPYSQQKADVEAVLGEVLLERRSRWPMSSGPASWPVPRRGPCFRRSPISARRGDAGSGGAAAPLPARADPGTRFQLVHEQDVDRAFRAGVRGLGEPGPYNLAGSGTLTMSDLADAPGWCSVPIPKLAVEATAEIATRLPLVPDPVAWLHSARKPVLMRTERARKLLRWRPQHTARRALEAMVSRYREGSSPAELRPRRRSEDRP
jgi:UDP-glucose 4-epimerase